MNHIQENIAHGLTILKRVDEAIDRADGKSSIVAAATVGLLSIAIALMIAANETSLVSLSKLEEYTAWALVFVYFFLSTISTYYSLFALFPRLKSKSTSVFYFGFLSEFTNVADLEKYVTELSGEQKHTQIIKQMLLTSEIAQTKYQYLRRSVWFLFASGLIWSFIMVRVATLVLMSIY